MNLIKSRIDFESKIKFSADKPIHSSNLVACNLLKHCLDVLCVSSAVC